ncbi:MAG: hypothetical protein ACK4UO_17040 [Pseudolabrys sp.]
MPPSQPERSDAPKEPEAPSSEGVPEPLDEKALEDVMREAPL